MPLSHPIDKRSRRKPFKKKKGGLSLKQQQQVRSLATSAAIMQAETKVYMNSVTANIDSTGTMYDLTGIALTAGDPNARDGNEIRLQKLNVKLGVGVADTFNAFRFIIFRWNETTAPVVADILEFLGTATIGIVSQYVKVPDEIFSIFMDKIVVVNTANPFAVRDWSPRVYNIKTSYDAATSADGYKNRVYMLALSDSGVSTHPQLDFTWALSYTDS